MPIIWTSALKDFDDLTTLVEFVVSNKHTVKNIGL